MKANRLATRSFTAIALCLLCSVAPAHAQKWVTSWAASVQGPYPVGNPTAQPELRFALPSQDTGAKDQTFRLMDPEVLGKVVTCRRMVDGRNVLDPEAWRAAGWTYRALGRP